MSPDPWQDAVEDAVHDAAPQHGLDPDELLDVTYDDEGDPVGTGVDFVQRLDGLADADPADPAFAQSVADEVASYAAELFAEPVQRSEDYDEEDLIRGEDSEDVAEPDDDEDDPSLDEILAMAEGDATRAAGHDVTLGHDELHHWWTAGPGLARWVNSPTPWRTLLANLVEAVKDKPLEVLKKWTSRWYIDVFHYAAGSDKARVAHGKPPRGHRVGPG